VGLYSKCTRVMAFENFENVCHALRTAGERTLKHLSARFSKALSIVSLYSECIRALTFQNVCYATHCRRNKTLASACREAGSGPRRWRWAGCASFDAKASCRHRFSKLFSLVFLYSKCTRTLICENVCYIVKMCANLGILQAQILESALPGPGAVV
jgi:hypothetical protein